MVCDYSERVVVARITAVHNVPAQVAREAWENEARDRVYWYVLHSEGLYDPLQKLEPYLFGLADYAWLDFSRNHHGPYGSSLPVRGDLTAAGSDDSDDAGPAIEQLRIEAARKLGLNDSEYLVILKGFVEGKTASTIQGELGIGSRRAYDIWARFAKRLRLVGVVEKLKYASFDDEEIKLVVLLQEAVIAEIPCEQRYFDAEVCLQELDKTGVPSHSELDRRDKTERELARAESEIGRLRRQRVRRVATVLGVSVKDAAVRFHRLLENPHWRKLTKEKKQVANWLVVAEDWVRFGLERSGVQASSIEVFMQLWLNRETATIRQRLQAVLGSNLTLKETLTQIRSAIEEVEQKNPVFLRELAPGIRKEYQS